MEALFPDLAFAIACEPEGGVDWHGTCGGSHFLSLALRELCSEIKMSLACHLLQEERNGRVALFEVHSDGQPTTNRAAEGTYPARIFAFGRSGWCRQSAARFCSTAGCHPAARAKDDRGYLWRRSAR